MRNPSNLGSKIHDEWLNGSATSVQSMGPGNSGIKLGLSRVFSAANDRDNPAWRRDRWTAVVMTLLPKGCWCSTVEQVMCRTWERKAETGLCESFLAVDASNNRGICRPRGTSVGSFPPAAAHRLARQNEP